MSVQLVQAGNKSRNREQETNQETEQIIHHPVQGSRVGEDRGHTFGFGRRPWGLGLHLREMPFEASMWGGRRAGRRPGRTEEWRRGRGWSGLAVGEECRAGGSCFLAERSVAWQRNSVVRGFCIPTRPYPSRARQISSGAKLSRARARPPPPNILPLARARLPAASRRLCAA